MDNFSFLIHPLDASQFAKKFPPAKYLSKNIIEKISLLIPPFKASNIKGIKSPFNSVEGWFVLCPLTASQMINLPQELVLKRIIKTGKLAEKLGARILGLGAFSKVIGDAGVTISKALDIPVTTGNSYTVATAIEATVMAAKEMDHDLMKANIAVIGATGSIGRVCAHIIARDAKFLTLVGQNEGKLDSLATEILYNEGLAVRVTTNTSDAVKKADIIITVTSSVETIINPWDIKPGAVICDVARPRDVSHQVIQLRDDVMVIEGGIVEIPGDVDFGFNFGCPPKLAYACMAETMILALEGRYESYTLGRDIDVKQVEQIWQLGKKHGFKIGGFRSFGKPLTSEEIYRIKNNALSNNNFTNHRKVVPMGIKC